MDRKLLHEVLLTLSLYVAIASAAIIAVLTWLDSLTLTGTLLLCSLFLLGGASSIILGASVLRLRHRVATPPKSQDAQNPQVVTEETPNRGPVTRTPDRIPRPMPAPHAYRAPDERLARIIQGQSQRSEVRDEVKVQPRPPRPPDLGNAKHRTYRCGECKHIFALHAPFHQRDAGTVLRIRCPKCRVHGFIKVPALTSNYPARRVHCIACDHLFVKREILASCPRCTAVYDEAMDPRFGGGIKRDSPYSQIV